VSCTEASLKNSRVRPNRWFTSSYLLAILALGGCGGNGTSNSTTTNTVVVTLSPTSANVTTSNTQQFTATVEGTTNKKVTWTATAGTIDDTGLYTAPVAVPSPAVVFVTATSVANSSYAAAAQVTIQPGPNAISMTLSPVSGTVASFGTLQFSATIAGDASTAVTWYVNGVEGGSRSAGFISANGLFAAPGGVPTTTNGNITKATTALISAVLKDNPAYSATANVVILPGNQSVQSIPIELGTSGGNRNDSSSDNSLTICCGGTLGALLALNDTQYILSTNHTLARGDGANIGDPIVQPGLLDANCDTSRVNTVATLSKFFSLKNSQTPNIDAAIAEVAAGTVDGSGKIFYLGDSLDANDIPLAAAPHGGSGLAADATLIGREVAKSGRTTGLTCSTVDSVGVSLTVEYVQNCDGTGKPVNVEFSGQIDVEGSAFSAQGDSGALVVSQDTADPVGLLFASSDSSSVANPISDVLSYFTDASGNPAAVVGAGAHSVIGCTLPTAPNSAATTNATATPTRASIQNATRARDAHMSGILAYPEVQGIGVGASRDNPSEAAILVFVQNNPSRTSLPREIDGVRTRIISVTSSSRHGVLSEAESARIEQSAVTPSSQPMISAPEFARAKIIHAANAAILLKKDGVQGVGISPSLDSSGEAALMVFVVRGAAHDAIPAIIQGVRTRVKESSRFRANYGGSAIPRSCRLPYKPSTKQAARQSLRSER
jgi:hypothetical protein